MYSDAAQVQPVGTELHELVLKVQFELQESDPDPKLKLEQLCPLRLDPSQSSPNPIIPSPHLEQRLVSNWHVALLQLRAPLSNPIELQDFPLRFVPSHSSAPSIVPFPQVSHLLKSKEQSGLQPMVPVTPSPKMDSQVAVPTNSPSHCSVPSSFPFPQVLQPLMLNLHISVLHVSVPGPCPISRHVCVIGTPASQSSSPSIIMLPQLEQLL